MARETSRNINPRRIQCAVFDFAGTLSADGFYKTAPQGYPRWEEALRQHLWDNPAIAAPLLKGEISTAQAAERLAKDIGMEAGSIRKAMEAGGRGMRLNLAVWNFSLLLRMGGRKTALVCTGPDLFERVTEKEHKLERTFDVVVSSAEIHEMSKEILWRAAFERLGEGMGFDNSLLVDYRQEEVEKFRKLGGQAVQYRDEKSFNKWTHSFEWERAAYGSLA